GFLLHLTLVVAFLELLQIPEVEPRQLIPHGQYWPHAWRMQQAEAKVEARSVGHSERQQSLEPATALLVRERGPRPDAWRRYGRLGRQVVVRVEAIDLPEQDL